jgi:hypothetical protein
VLVLLSPASPSVLCCGEGLRLDLLWSRLGLECLVLALAALGRALAEVVWLTVSSIRGCRARLSLLCPDIYEHLLALSAFLIANAL